MLPGLRLSHLLEKVIPGLRLLIPSQELWRGELVSAAANTRANWYCGVVNWSPRWPIREWIGIVAWWTGGLAKILRASGAPDFRSCRWLPRAELISTAANARAYWYCGVAHWYRGNLLL